MKHEDLLKDKNLRITKQRKMILEAIEAAENPISAEEIFEDIKDEGLDLSTVYRNLNILEEKSVLLKTTNIDGISYYQLHTDSHKHFITCNICHSKYIIENCPIHELEDQVENETGFQITGHNFEFTGICPSCQQSN